VEKAAHKRCYRATGAGDFAPWWGTRQGSVLLMDRDVAREKTPNLGRAP